MNNIFSVGAGFAVFAGCFVAVVTAWTNLRVARINAEKEKWIQKTELEFRSLEEYKLTSLKELEFLYRVISKIAMEFSKTMSYMQSEQRMEVAEYRKRYLSLCDQLHEAKSKIAVKFPGLLDHVNAIYGQGNVFWGSQETMLRITPSEESDVCQIMYTKMHEITTDMSKLISKMQWEIREHAKEINSIIYTADQG